MCVTYCFSVVVEALTVCLTPDGGVNLIMETGESYVKELVKTDKFTKPFGEFAKPIYRLLQRVFQTSLGSITDTFSFHCEIKKKLNLS